MTREDLLAEVASTTVKTPRLATHLLYSGPQDGIPVLFVHGNVSGGRFFGETLAALPGYRTFVPDLRGFGASERKPLDATRGSWISRTTSTRSWARSASANAPSTCRVVGGRAGSYAVRGGPSRGGGLTRPTQPHEPFRFWRNRGRGRDTLLARLRRLGRRHRQPGVRRAARCQRSVRRRPQLPEKRHEQHVFRTALQVPTGARRGTPLLHPLHKDWRRQLPWRHDQLGKLARRGPGERGMNNAITPKYSHLTGFGRIELRPPVL